MQRFVPPLFVVVLFGFTPAQSFQLGYFPSLPKAIDGCSGTFTYDSISLKKEKYIFVDDLQEQAFIFVGGKEIVLKKVKDIVSADGKKFHTVYTGSGYTATLLIREIKAVGDEVGYFEGTLEVVYGQTSAKFKIHGEAGC